MKPTIGRIVIYTLNEQDAAQINKRRDAYSSIGNAVSPGEQYPAIVVRIWDESINLKVMLDGNDEYWATSIYQGDGFACWTWPTREMPKAACSVTEKAIDTVEVLRKALSGLVGAETKEELEHLEIAMRATPGINADKIAGINAIHALLSLHQQD